jgi:uncharacterized protein (DUF952 family)
MPTLYKICPAALWREAEREGFFRGSDHDIRDGFIHFSTSAQVAETAAKHFAGQDDLLLIAVESTPLGDALKWERSRGESLFPHFYGVLNLDVVTNVEALTLGTSGLHVFPALKS